MHKNNLNSTKEYYRPHQQLTIKKGTPINQSILKTNKVVHALYKDLKEDYTPAQQLHIAVGLLGNIIHKVFKKNIPFYVIPMEINNIANHLQKSLRKARHPS